jgi:hypothetical protein
LGFGSPCPGRVGRRPPPPPLRPLSTALSNHQDGKRCPTPMDMMRACSCSVVVVVSSSRNKQARAEEEGGQLAMREHTQAQTIVRESEPHEGRRVRGLEAPNRHITGVESVSDDQPMEGHGGRLHQDRFGLVVCWSAFCFSFDHARAPFPSFWGATTRTRRASPPVPTQSIQPQPPTPTTQTETKKKHSRSQGAWGRGVSRSIGQA